MFLPETLGQPFPETIEEVERLYDNAKPWFKWVKKSKEKKGSFVDKNEDRETDASSSSEAV